MRDLFKLSLSHRERGDRVAVGEGFGPLVHRAKANSEPLIRPSGTFSLWEKGNKSASIGEWVL